MVWKPQGIQDSCNGTTAPSSKSGFSSDFLVIRVETQDHAPAKRAAPDASFAAVSASSDMSARSDCRAQAEVALACAPAEESVVNGMCMSGSVSNMLHPACYDAGANFLGVSEDKRASLKSAFKSVHDACIEATSQVCIWNGTSVCPMLPRNVAHW